MKVRHCTIGVTLVLALALASCGGEDLVSTEAPVSTSVTVLARGAQMHGANGIMFDSEDRLFIGSVFGNEIVVMDRESGNILKRLGPEVPVDTPDDLTFGPKGTPYEGYLYWTSIFSGWVNRLSPDGTLKQQMLSPGVNPITFSDDGRLFVALAFFGDGLYEVDPDLDDPPQPIIAPTPENPLPLGFLNAMDIGPDGFLYGPLMIPGEVVRINVNTGALDVIKSGLSTPGAVKFDSKGNLYVAEGSGEISGIDLLTGEKSIVATGLEGIDNIAFDSQDRMFVSNAQDGSIYEILPNGTPRSVSSGGMIAPGGLAVRSTPDGGESVFVADYWTLREFNGLTGKQESVERSNITVAGTMIGPSTVALDGENVVLTDLDVVQVWDPEIGAEIESYNDFALPLNAIRFQGDLVVAEFVDPDHGWRVVRHTTSGRVTLANWEDGIYAPMGFAATGGGLWISDWYTGSVWQLYDGGVLLDPPRRVAESLASPEGLAVDRDGSLLVVESGAGRLSRINLTGGAVETVTQGLELGYAGFPPDLPMGFFNGVAVGPSGAIYVTGDKTNVLYRVEVHG